MVGRVGLEPTTNGLKGRCSTTELPTREALQCRESRGTRQRAVKLLQVAARCQPAGPGRGQPRAASSEWARRGHPPQDCGSAVSALSEAPPSTWQRLPGAVRSPLTPSPENPPFDVFSEFQPTDGQRESRALPTPRRSPLAPRPVRRRTDAHRHHGLHFPLARHAMLGNTDNSGTHRVPPAASSCKESPRQPVLPSRSHLPVMPEASGNVLRTRRSVVRTRRTCRPDLPDARSDLPDTRPGLPDKSAGPAGCLGSA